MADFSQALSLNPNHGNTYLNRGHMYATSGEFKKAIDDYNKVISLDPQDGLAYLNRGMAYYKLGENQKALSDLQKAIIISLQQGDMLNLQRARQVLQRIK